LKIITGLGSSKGEIEIGSQKLFELSQRIPHVKEFLKQVQKFDNDEISKLSKKILTSRKSKGL
jgi:ABC-type phosphate transport system auxiliary subunit